MNRPYMTICLCLCLMLLLGGCVSPKPAIVTKPELIEVTKWRTQPIPGSLVRQRECPGVDAIQTTEDLVSAYQACWTANQQHNVDKRKIEGLSAASHPR